MCISFKRMSSESKSNSISASTSGRIRRERRSLLDHIVDSVANMAPELERETSSTTSCLHATKADNDSTLYNSKAVDKKMSSLTSSIKHIELQDLRAEQASASFTSAASTTTNLTSSFSSSWSTTRSHLLVAEEIVSHLESEMVQQEGAPYETQEGDAHEHEVSKDRKDEASSSPLCSTPHDPFAKDSNFSVGEDGLITLSSLLSDDEEACAGSSSFKNAKRSWMNRAA